MEVYTSCSFLPQSKATLACSKETGLAFGGGNVLPSLIKIPFDSLIGVRIIFGVVLFCDKGPANKVASFNGIKPC